MAVFGLLDWTGMETKMVLKNKKASKTKMIIKAKKHRQTKRQLPLLEIAALQLPPEEWDRHFDFNEGR